MLVNNAGRSMRGKVLDTTPEQFRDLMELNFMALVRCTRAAVPHLLANKGHVVNIGSLAAKSASRWVGAYPATKHAVAAYSQQLRLELGAARAARAAGLPRPHRSGKTRGCIRWRAWKTCPSTPGGPAAACGSGAIPPERLAAAILRACERRKPELVMPGVSRAAVRPDATLAVAGRLVDFAKDVRVGSQHGLLRVRIERPRAGPPWHSVICRPH